MDVHPRFFTREEIKSVMAIPKNRRTHFGRITNFWNVSTCFSESDLTARVLKQGLDVLGIEVVEHVNEFYKDVALTALRPLFGELS
jgi:hypothetical protein